MIYTSVAVASSYAYWHAVRVEYKNWVSDQEGKGNPYIPTYAEWASAQAMATIFVLSKNRPWKIKNWLAYFIGKLFL